MKLTAPNLVDCMIVREWRNNEMESLRTPYLLTEEMQEQFYREVVCNRDSEHRYWSVVEEHVDEPTELMAYAGITNISWANAIGEISLIINPEKREKGNGEKAVDLVFNVGFNFMGLKTIIGEVYVCNSAIDFWRKIAQKYNGYTTMLPNRKYWAGKYYDAMYFSVDKGEFNRIHELNNAG